MREIVLDTETTGLDPADGHRIIEIGALEIRNLMPTGNQLHLYINPQRDIDPDAEKVHGLSAEFLSDKPVFEAVAGAFLDFIGDDPLVIHNAPFDVGFLNAELDRLGHPALSDTRIIDTLPMARRKFPGAKASLDALCKRFDIDNTHRELHGALIDADLLAAVYVELKGGRQPGLLSDPGQAANSGANTAQDTDPLAGFLLEDRPVRAPRPHPVDTDELAAHEAFIATLTDPIWLDDGQSES